MTTPASGSSSRRSSSAGTPDSAVNQAVAAISEDIASGFYQPGDQLIEQECAQDYQVSRNTLREAFRILQRQQLLVHQPHKGVFLRSFDSEATAELYAYRRFVQLAAVDAFAYASEDKQQQCIGTMISACDAAYTAQAEGDWRAVGTRNSEVHLALVDVAGIPKLSEDMRIIMVQSRLAFLSAAHRGDLATTHGPFIDGNRELANVLTAVQQAANTSEEARDAARRQARAFLHDYLDRAERTVIDLIEGGSSALGFLR